MSSEDPRKTELKACFANSSSSWRKTVSIASAIGVSSLIEAVIRFLISPSRSFNKLRKIELNLFKDCLKDFVNVFFLKLIDSFLEQF